MGIAGYHETTRGFDNDAVFFFFTKRIAGDVQVNVFFFKLTFISQLLLFRLKSYTEKNNILFISF